MKKIISLTIIFCLALGLLLGCSSKQDNKQDNKKGQKVLKIGYNFATNSLDPNTDTAYYTLRIGVGETLTRIDKNSKLAPWLATSWRTEDYQHWEFTIANGITFHNGDPCDAEAVMNSLWRNIKGNKLIANTLNIASMEAKGQTLKITTKGIYPGLPNELAHPQSCLLHPKKEGQDLMPIGTGPYKVVSFEPKGKVVLAKYNKYWAGMPKLDEVHWIPITDANTRLMSLQSGDVDLMLKPSAEVVSVLQSNSKFHVDNVKSTNRCYHLVYNNTKKYTENIDFRKGLDCLIDTDSIIKKFFYGLGSKADGVFATIYSFAPVSYEDRPYSKEKALEYFKAAGLQVANGKVTDKGKPIKLTIINAANYSEFSAVAQYMQSIFASLGIELEVVTLSESILTYQANDANLPKWDIAINQMLTCPRGDAAYVLGTAYSRNGSLNYARYKDEELFKIVDEYLVTGDEAKRTALSKKATEIIDQKCYNSWFMYPNVISVYNKEKVSSWWTDPNEYYLLTKDVDVFK